MKFKTLKRLAMWSATVTLMVYGLGLGSCSLRSIALGMLSDFLTSGGTSQVNSAVGSGISSVLSGLLGTST